MSECKQGGISSHGSIRVITLVEHYSTKSSKLSTIRNKSTICKISHLNLPFSIEIETLIEKNTRLGLGFCSVYDGASESMCLVALESRSSVSSRCKRSELCIIQLIKVTYKLQSTHKCQYRCTPPIIMQQSVTQPPINQTRCACLFCSCR